MSAPARNVSPDFLAGLRGGLPFFLVMIPFGFLFGVLAGEAGLSLTQTMVMTMAVIAGAAQFTALQMIAQDAGLILIISTALAVNLRMAMYSVSMVPHLGALPVWKRALLSYILFDQTYAVAILHYEQYPQRSTSDKFLFFIGVAVPIVPTWAIATWAGAVFGNLIPPGSGLDFALPITFIAMIGPALRTLPHILAAVSAVISMLFLASMPSGIGILCAAMIGMFTGALSEWIIEKRSTTP